MQTVPRNQVFLDDTFPLGVQRAAHHAVTMHSHEFSELVIVTDGHGSHVTGTREYPIRAGDVFVIHGERSHEYSVQSSMEIVNVLFDLERLPIPLMDLKTLPGFHALFTFEPAFRHSDRLNSRLRLSATQLSGIGVTLNRLEAQFRARSPGWRFAALALFMDLLSALSRCYSHIPESRQASQVMRLSEVVSYLEGHYAAAIRLDDLAAMAHMSRSTLLRAFRRAFGRAPVEYLLRLRIDRAADLLRSGQHALPEIAAAVGFRDSNYLSRQFRAITGTSPREYRRRYGATTQEK